MKTSKYSFCGLSKHAHNKYKMADGCHFGNIEKSSYLSNGSTDCHETVHNNAHWPFHLYLSYKF